MCFYFLSGRLAIIGKSLRGLREQFVQASIESDDIHDLLRDDPFAQTCEGAKDEDGVLSTREGQRSHSIPDFEHTPSRVSTTPQVPITDPSAPRRGGSSWITRHTHGFKIAIFRYATCWNP